ncbi:MAG: hypothetical protein ACO2PM_05125 [Pyrobaculum sp.]
MESDRVITVYTLGMFQPFLRFNAPWVRLVLMQLDARCFNPS